jgi:hypothetical protein
VRRRFRLLPRTASPFDLLTWLVFVVAVFWLGVGLILYALG